MPWTVKDVDEHKKGLTPAQKKKWAKIANSVLRECERRAVVIARVEPYG